ncbi:MAG: sigma-70 family RNA polymerase sigma factor [Bdellovibrionales bacterium]|jgi:RNA polymerase sigma-70 factor (ECF subfamily)|nr:sigma-70 family RNA polymerase sigma factor [Bdellovibrionales bacterium]
MTTIAPPFAFLPPESLAFRPHARLQKPMAHIPQQDAPRVAASAPATPHEDLLVQVGTRQDRDAFRTLFEYYAPRLKSYLLKHGASEALAEEAVQNTFVTIWEKAAQFDPHKAAASTWIFTIARNRRIDALRREKYVEINSDSPALEQAASPAPDDAYVDSITAEKLHAAIDALPEDQASLLRMAFFEDKTHQAISDETHIPLGTVKSRLRIALEKLRGGMALRKNSGEKTK